MQIWLFSIQIVIIYTSNSCKMNDMSQFVECVREAQKKSTHGLITDLITINNHLYFLKKKNIKIHKTHKIVSSL